MNKTPISISVLAWNNLDCTKILLESIFEEIKSIKDCKFKINVFNNGSDDGTKEYLYSLENIDTISSDKNIGISRSKNILIKSSLNSKYMFMFDNDVCVRKGSFRPMIDFMDKNENIACLGQNIDNYTKNIDDSRIKENVFEINDFSYDIRSGCGAIRAWTHYSIYRTSVFKEGILFCEEGPFAKAGYGFDDDDLGMQIFEKGYRIACFNDIICYHKINSSIGNLSKSTGLNFEERERWFKNKWKI